MNCKVFARAIFIAVVGMGWVPAYADHVSGDLRDFITNLYGGDGIILPPAPNIPPQIAQAHQPHFTGATQIAQLNALSTGLLSGIGDFSLNSTVTGLSFDLSTGAPVAVEDSLGPLLAERARTIGQGRLSFSFSYSSQDFKELDGHKLKDIQVTLTHQDCCAVGPPPIPPPDGQLTGFENDTIVLDIDIDIKQDVYALFTNYGITDRWDIGAVVPIVSIDAKASSSASIMLSDPTGGSVINGSPVHSFSTDPADAFSETGGSKTGLGDVILRSKYNFLRADEGGPMDLAVLLQATFETGNESKLLGAGENQYRAMLIASKTLGRVTPHLNVAYSVPQSNSDLENLTYAAGFDARFTDRFTGAIDLLGRHNPHVKEIGNNIVDLAIAAKWNPFTNRNMPLNAFVRFPLNDDGLRADVIWGVGIDLILD